MKRTEAVVVESYEPLARMLDEMLVHEGFQVVGVFADASCFQICSSHPEALVVVDANIVGMNVSKFIDELKFENLARKVIIINGREERKDHGADYVLKKPFGLEDFRMACRAIGVLAAIR